jgi:NAD(P)-dependent dehydrogenase (short-subunit alcohol dehydrogenase family)
MDPRGRAVVVTGGGSGIGRALARRFATEGARGVVVADLDTDAARAVAEEIGEQARAVDCDVADDAQIGQLLTQAHDAFGPIDVFCANAGVIQHSGLDAPDAAWDVALGVNVRAHVYAARRLVPSWIERGEGYWLSTASAAGLLTQIGSAPYSVTKHAAVAFAEWLSVTYGDRGVRVSCVCPMGVETAMTTGQGSLGARVVASAGAMLQPEDVAAAVVEAMRQERFLVLPHPEVLDYFRRKGADYDRWIAGMRRLQSRVADAGA